MLSWATHYAGPVWPSSLATSSANARWESRFLLTSEEPFAREPDVLPAAELREPALAVARRLARPEAGVRLLRIVGLLLDAGAVAKRSLVDRVAAPVRALRRRRPRTDRLPTMTCFVSGGQWTKSHARSGRSSPRRSAAPHPKPRGSPP